MPIGLVGRKCGMTRIFTDAGESIPVTVIEALSNRVTTLKTAERDGYRAVQVAFGERKAERLSRPQAGVYSRLNATPGDGLVEFRLADEEGEELAAGAEIGVATFEAGQHVDVVGTTKGKGYAGTVKRHNFRTQDNTHGNSISHRAPGSIGQNQTPGRVFKGKKMSGHMGNVRRTAENLEIVRVDSDRNLILVKGAVPGSANGRVIIKPAVKA